MSFLMIPLGWLLKTLYLLVGNYGVAIILFTILIKLVLLPLTVKQQKSMIKTQKLQPILMSLQEKYGNDKEKLSQETMKVYQKYKVNPMSGCLPMLIQLPIIFALYWVVRQPIEYIMGVDKDQLGLIVDALTKWGETNPGGLSQLLGAIKMDSLQALADNSFKMFQNYEIVIARYLHMYPDILNYADGLGELITVDFNFLGMDLSKTPDLWALLGIFMGNVSNITLETVGLWIIPILSGVSSFVTTKITQSMQPPQPVQRDEFGNEKKNPMNTMMVFMPIFSAWIAFTLPAAIGLYWTISNVIQLLQQVLLTKFLKVDITDEQIEGEIVDAKKNRKKRKKR